MPLFRSGVAPVGAAVALAALIACDARVRDESAGETLVVVDTDMPVPALVSRLRIDLYGADGAWYGSRDVALARPEDWPTSFGLVPSGGAPVVTTVRLRAYPENGVRDYRGERFVPRPPPPASPSDAVASTPAPPPTDQPRLRGDTGADVTPPSEPQPALAIDRLLRVRVTPGSRASVRVVLHGACVGTMADVAGARTCVDQEDVRVAVSEEPAGPDPPAPSRSAEGSFFVSRPCSVAPRRAGNALDGAPLFDEEVCVPGAMYCFGTSDGLFFGDGADLPERVVLLRPFLVDRYEVTVGRYREALAAGFVSPDATPTANDGDLSRGGVAFTDPSTCTFSTTPRGRETYPLSCVSWAAARAFCRFAGGDLPSEAEWEYVATVAGRDHRTRFAWGGDDDAQPTCSRAVFGRGEQLFAGQSCIEDGFGPLPVDARAAPGTGDVTPGLGVVDLGGNVGEWTRDAFTPSLDVTCWAASALEDPGCFVDGDVARTLRGGVWRDNVAGLIAATRRREQPPGGSDVGFRCVRGGGS